jgi:tetratricopeptide (TPR) repeat protein
MASRSRTLLATTIALSVLLGHAGARAAGVAEFDRAARLVMDGDEAGALRAYESFLARAPADRFAPVAAAAAASLRLSFMSDTAAALRSLEFIVLEHPGSEWAPEAARQTAECAAARGEWRSAGEAYELAVGLASALDDRPSADWFRSLMLAAVGCYRRIGDPSKIIEIYRKVLDGSPAPEVAATALVQLGDAYESAGDARNAARSYARVVEAYPASEEFEQAMAKRELIGAHVEIDWRPYEAYAEGTRLVRQSENARALEKCEEILSGSPAPGLRECVEYRKIVLETLERGDFTEGVRRLRGFIDAHPGGQRTRLAQETLEAQWDPIARLEARSAASPGDSELLGALGQAYVQARAQRKGVAALEQALAIDPANDRSRQMVGLAYIEAGQLDRADESLSYYLDRNPTDTFTMNMAGYGFLQRGQIERALRYFERYVAAAPEEANAHDSYGEGLLAAERLEESAREYEKAVEIDPSFSNSWLMLGRVRRRMGETGRAIVAFERFLESSPDGPPADEAKLALRELRVEE